jgi:hypothetical protein
LPDELKTLPRRPDCVTEDIRNRSGESQQQNGSVPFSDQGVQESYSLSIVRKLFRRSVKQGNELKQSFCSSS